MEMRYGSLYQTKEKERLYDESLLISLFFSPLPQSFHQLYLSLDISFSLYISLSPHLITSMLSTSVSQNIFLRPRIFLFSSYYFSLIISSLSQIFSSLCLQTLFPFFSLQISRYVSLYISSYLSHIVSLFLHLSISLSLSPLL